MKKFKATKVSIALATLLILAIIVFFRFDIVTHGDGYFIGESAKNGDQAFIVECPLYDPVAPVILIKIQ